MIFLIFQELMFYLVAYFIRLNSQLNFCFCLKVISYTCQTHFLFVIAAEFADRYVLFWKHSAKSTATKYDSTAPSFFSNLSDLARILELTV